MLLETLQPTERAVFLLHEVFDYKHREIAAILEKSEAACRQILRRAKMQIAERRPRFTATPAQHSRLLQSFVCVVEQGEIEAFLQMLTEDVTLVPDGGGERRAAINILRGRDAVAAFALGTFKQSPVGVTYQIVWLNGQPAIVATTAEGRPYYALFLYGERERVSLIHVIAGRKLSALQRSSLDKR